MAFLRVEKKESGSYLRIIESFRESGKVRHKILYSLGKVEDYHPETLKRIGMRLYELGGGDLGQLLGESVKELGRFNYGFYQLVDKLLSHYKLTELLKRIEHSHHLEYSVFDAVMLMIIERLNDPVSKLSNYHNQEEYLGLQHVELHHLYRSLDWLSEYSEQIQNCIFFTGRTLFNQTLDVVFYDVTTFYFDSDVEIEGSLRQKGFSKDSKIGKTQIVFGLLIDKDKNPICYRVYSGDKWEGHTFEDFIQDLKKRFQIDKIIIVADRGMLNTDNLDAAVQNGYEFIVGERLKNLPKTLQAELINKENYKMQWVYNKDGEQITINYHTTQYKNRTIIGTFSKKRAEKDAAEREEKIEKAYKLLKDPSRLKKKERRFFIKNIGDEKYEIDMEKIEQSEKYDGFLAISTNNQTLSTTVILDHYKHLFQIEHSFRTFKSHLETRPMFHWTNKRIEGHMALCYITYTLQNYCLQKLSKAGMAISEKMLRKYLSKMQVSLLEQKKRRFYLRSKNEDGMANMINKLGMKKLPNLFPMSQINRYL